MGQSSSNVKITSQDRSILNLKLQRDKLRQYQKKIEIVSKSEEKIAKEALAAGNKSKALTALRHRKYQESLLTQTDSQLEVLQKLVSSIEFSLVEKDVVFGLKQGNAVLKQLHQELNLNTVEQLMSDTAEGIAYQNELDQVMIGKMSTAEEEEVLAELAELQATAESKATTLPELPKVPTSAITDTVDEVHPEVEEQPGRIAQRQALPA